MDRIRVLIADDHPLFREGMHGLLDSVAETEVVGEATTGAEAIAQAKALQPDVILMDIKMPGINGIAATREIVAASPHISILMVTMLEDDESVFAAMRAGARGYVLKGANQAEILRAIRAVASGEAIFGPGIAKRVLGYFSAARTTVGPHPQNGTQPCLQHLQQTASGGSGAGGPAGTGSRVGIQRDRRLTWRVTCYITIIG